MKKVFLFFSLLFMGVCFTTVRDLIVGQLATAKGPQKKNFCLLLQKDCNS